MENKAADSIALPQNQKLSQIITDEAQNRNTLISDDVEISKEIFFSSIFAEDLDLSIDDECGSIGTIDDVPEMEPMRKKQKSSESLVETDSDLIQPISTSLKISHDQLQRVKYLLQVPSLMAKCVNSFDEEGFRALIYDVCIEDCRCKSSSVPEDLIGRDYIIKYFVAGMNTFPDVVMQVKPPTVRQRTISASLESRGTRVRTDPNSYLFDHLRYGSKENVSFVRAQQHVEAIEASGRLVSFKSKSLLQLVINKEMTHIERWISLRKSITATPAKDITDAQI